MMWTECMMGNMRPCSAQINSDNANNASQSLSKASFSNESQLKLAVYSDYINNLSMHAPKNKVFSQKRKPFEIPFSKQFLKQPLFSLQTTLKLAN